MTDQKENKETFWHKLKKSAVAKVIAVIVLIGYTVGKDIYDTYNHGKEKQEEAIREADFEARVEKKVKDEVNNPTLLLDIIGSQFIQDFVNSKHEDIEQAVTQKIVKKDSVELNMITYIGQETGLRDEAVLGMLMELVKLHNEGKLPTKEQVEDISKDVARDVVSRRTISHDY